MAERNSNWNEKAEEATAGRGYEFSGEAWAFVEGAKWMRRQLRTDEAVERVAEQMFTATQAAYEYQDRTDWHELHKSNQDVYRSDARTAITALLGEEP